MKLSAKYAIFAFMAIPFASCLSDGNETFILTSVDQTPADNLGIPQDSEATANPSVSDNNTDIPNAPVVYVNQEGYCYLPITGIRGNKDKWIELKGTGEAGQNIWVQVDGQPKGIVPIKIEDLYLSTKDDDCKIPHDIVFLIDNSSSMTDEINTLANGLYDWADELTNSGIDMRIGLVGYEEGTYSINGAFDLCDPSEANAYLHIDGGNDNMRTRGFRCVNRDALKQAAESGKYHSGYYTECGIVALRFANENFSFRAQANRVYINLTDEPNQPGNLEEWSVEYLDPANGYWNAAMGTVHCIFDGDTQFEENRFIIENPWRMATYTGGTSDFFDNSFTGIKMSDLKVTQALKNAYVVKFRPDKSYTDGKPHKVDITVKSTDGKVSATKSMYTFFK